MLRNSLIFVLVIAVGVIFYSLFTQFDGNDELSDLAQFYAQKENIDKVGSANLVTAVVVTYRGLDTLGEVTILFLTAAIIGFFLKGKLEEGKREVRPSSEILQTAAAVLIPIIIVFGVYIFINGHLTPGGGFQGGAIIASAIILMLLTRPTMPFNHKLFSTIESISGLSFITLGVLGALFAGGFLDNRFIETGTVGELISGGAIPIIYSFVGLKVGAELSNILGDFQEVQNEK